MARSFLSCRTRSTLARRAVPAHLLMVTMLMSGAAQAAVIVAPNAWEAAIGPGIGNSGGAPAGSPILHMQQVYAGTEFSTLVGPGYITAMAFRPDENQPGVTAENSDYEVRLSTTSRGVDGLSSVFSANPGADNLLVHDGAILWRSSASADGTLKNFDYQVVFSKPFLYDPSKGNLLVDISLVGSSSGGTAYLDYARSSDDGVSRISAPTLTGNATEAATIGAITQFTAVAVPEPETWALCLLGLGAISFAVRRRTRDTGAQSSRARAETARMTLSG